MKSINWMDQILYDIDSTISEYDTYRKIAEAFAEVGFKYCKYCLYYPWPLTSQRVFMLSNFPEAWQRRYNEANYIDIDPIFRHVRQSCAPIIWSDDVFKETPHLWQEAQAHGLRYGYSLASVSNLGVAGMISLARSEGPITPRELEQNELKIRWLVNAAHLMITRAVLPKLSPNCNIKLTSREIEVLKWAGDGKTASEIAMIMLISVNTVNFHVKNAVAKLKTSNTTAAVARAALMGLLF
jgi:DNA-binding CsgD family transcriptional regulator